MLQGHIYIILYIIYHIYSDSKSTDLISFDIQLNVGLSIFRGTFELKTNLKKIINLCSSPPVYFIIMILLIIILNITFQWAHVYLYKYFAGACIGVLGMAKYLTFFYNNFIYVLIYYRYKGIMMNIH